MLNVGRATVQRATAVMRYGTRAARIAMLPKDQDGERLAIADAVRVELGNRRGQRTDKLVQNSAQVDEDFSNLRKTRDIASKKSGLGSHYTLVTRSNGF